MLGRRATPERRAQLAQQALAEIKGLRAKLVLLDLQARPGLLGLPDRLVLKACRAFLAWWEQREQQVLKGPQAPPVRRGQPERD